MGVGGCAAGVVGRQGKTRGKRRPHTSTDPPPTHPPVNRHPPAHRPPKPPHSINQARAFNTTPWQAAALGAALCIAAPFYFPYVALGAWRRGRLRVAHGLPGSTLEDVVLWGCLSPCATCQETRTLEVNGVRNGVWGGAPAEVATVPPPAVESMKK